MDAVRGILLTTIAAPRSAAEHQARWRRAKADLRVLFEHGVDRHAARAS